MVKRKINYDSPFDREELESLERQTILDSEQLRNTEYSNEVFDYPPNESVLNLPTSIWLSAFRSPFVVGGDDEDAYSKYKEIEGLE